jgi:CHAT domain-containing protein
VDRLYVDHKIDVDFTEDATFETIQSYLNERDYQVVHFTGHGRQTDGQGYLVLETEDNRAREVDNQTISDLFVGKGIRLVVLSACQSGKKQGSRGRGHAILRA